MPATPAIAQIGAVSTVKALCLDCNWSHTEDEARPGPTSLAQDHARHMGHRTSVLAITNIYYGPTFAPVPVERTP